MSLNLLPTTISSAPLSGLLNYDVLTQTIYYSSTAAVGNFQINFRGDSVTTFASVVPVGNTLETTLFVQMGSTPHALTAITIDGVTPSQILGIKQLPILWASNTTARLSISITQTSAGVFLVY
jgi:hypothetical protein